MSARPRAAGEVDVRLHRLTITAFGPFPGTEVVDLDALSQGGLFLLHGPTGAGKSSVLDAVCFALYGRLPGARAGTTRLRSDHAPEGASPEVVCEFSVGPRRFEVTRRPAWERPKRRGAGTTREQASTLLRELVAGRWVARSDRNDEAAHLLADMLGMGAEQFTQVVMLPQGEFATLLRAPADDRRPVLQRLFATDRFAAVEAWLGEERRRLNRLVDEADSALDRDLARAHQAAQGVPGLRDDDQPRDDDSPVPGDPVQQVQQWSAAADAAARIWSDAESAAAATRRRADEELTAARHLRDRQQEEAEARHALAALQRSAPEHSDQGRRLAAARRAAPVAVHLAYLDRAVATLQSSSGQLDAAAAAAVTAGVPVAMVQAARAGDGGTAGGGSGPAEPVDDVLAAWREEVVRLDDLTEQVDALAQLEEALADARRDLDAAVARQRDAHQVGERAASRLWHLLPRVEAARDASAQLEAHARDVPRAAAVQQAATARVRLLADVRHRQSALADLRETALRARERELDLRQRRLDGMAAELAARLVAGDPCPVCGGVEHPRRARRRDGSVDERSEQEARQRSEEAEARRAAAQDALAVVERELAAAEAAASGLTPQEAAERLEAAQQAHTDAQRSRQELTDLAAESERLDALCSDQTAREQQAATMAASAQERVTLLTERRDATADRLRQAQGPDRSVPQRRQRILEQCERLEEVLRCAEDEHRFRQEHATAASAAEAAVCDAGFEDAAAARGALLDEAARARLQQQVDAYAAELAAVTSRLQDPALAAAAAQEPPDLDALDRSAAADASASGHATAQAARARDAATALRQLLDQVRSLAGRAEPLRARAALVSELSRCAEGSGGDNAMRMRLSSYVLAARLEQVAAAASERLLTMSAGRYTLVHCDRPERGGSRSGLGLRVVDAWTGCERETATLSGGESFMASLALALGLADVVLAESGGAPVETLFVDEGFGSLDEEALEEVLGVLDDLRDGGRAVGVVSHVAELRARVPVQLEVLRHRDGSSLRQLIHTA